MLWKNPVRIPAAVICIAVFGCVFVTALWVFMVAQIRNEYAAAAASELRKNGNLVLAHETHARQLLREADQLLRLVKDQYERPGPRPDLKRLTEMGTVDPQVFSYVGIINGKGDLVMSTRSSPSINLQDREYFKFHRDHKNDAMRIGEPVMGRVSGTWVIPLTRRINHPDGSFAGVANISVDPQYLIRLFQQADLGTSDGVALLRSDGVVLARRSGDRISIGENLGRSQLIGEQRNQPVGGFLGTSAIDGKEKFFSYRTLSEYPLIVMVATLKEEVLAQARQREERYLTQSGLATMLCLVFCMAFAGFLMRERRAAEAMRKSEESLATTLQSLEEAVIVTDTQGQIMRMNPAAERLTGWCLADALGNPLDRVFCPVDMHTRASVPDLVRQVLQEGRAASRMSGVAVSGENGKDLPIAMSAAPLRDTARRVTGVVVVFADVAEQQRLQQAVAESEQRLRKVMDGLGSSIFAGLMTPDGVLIEANRPAWADGRLKIEGMLGKPFEDACCWTHSPVAREQLRHAVQQARRGEASHFETRICIGRNRFATIEFFLNVLRDEQGGIAYLVPSAIDITAHKQAQEAQARLAAIVEHSNDAIVSRALDGTILSWNASAEKLLGYTAAEMIGQSTERMLPADKIANRSRHNERILRGEVLVHESVRIARDGRRIDILTRHSPLRDARGAIIGVSTFMQDISERKRADEAQARLAAIVESSNDAIFSRTLDGTILSWNAGATRMLGYSAEEAIGKAPHFMLPPERPPNLLRNNRRALAGDVLPRESDRLTKDGRIISVLASHSPLKDGAGNVIGVSVTLQDITALKQAQAAARESDERFRAAFESAAVGIAIRASDPENPRLLRVNRRFCEIVGYTQEELAGLNILDLTPPEDRPAALEHMKRLNTEGMPSYERERRYRRKDGSLVWANISVANAYGVDGKPGYTVSVIEDISERKRIEAERTALEVQLREAQKMEAVGTLAGGIAHDFNNIVGAILGNAELARRDAQGRPTVLESLEEIRKAGRRARDLVQQILSFSRNQATELVPVSLSDAVGEPVRLLRVTIPANVALHHEPCEDPLTVLADVTQIQQVILNLVTNAVQALRSRGGSIIVRVDAVQLSGAEARAHAGLVAGRHARIRVIDNGPGMDADTRARIFEPFFTTKPRGEGTGLGLSVVFGIVKSHRGAVNVISEPGRGATFEVFLPVSEAVPHPPRAEPAVTPQAGEGQHILYVDDDESLVFLVERLLARSGYRVSGFTDQEAALSALSAAPDDFDLLLTDYNMPGMTGLDVARAAHNIRPGLPVVIASGYITDELRARAAEAGVRDMIFKANAVEEFCAVIRRVVLQPVD